MLLCIGNLISAQTSITGKVTGDGEDLPGVNIVLKGTTTGTMSELDGTYTIADVPDGDYTLVATFIGYKAFSKPISVKGVDLVVNILLTQDALALEDIVVTGVVNPKSRIESSISITAMKPAKITESAPRSTAEIFRSIPGIRAESSGGEGNANIAVRGVPISSGGSKYLQLQEDGLPVLLYGDIAFATADMFTRFDNNVARIEAIRGGSASTLSSNSPGGIINIISKTGAKEEGSISTTFGLDYNSFRTDMNYGGRISDDLYFHIGGFYRVGEGVRKAGFTANNGGQLKFNLTKEFSKGYIRLYGKVLDDRAAAYMPMPMQVTGTNSNPKWSSISNYSATHGALQTPHLTQMTTLNEAGALERFNVEDGMHVKTKSIGIEFKFDLPNDWKVSNNGRYSANNGGFTAPFSARTAIADTIIKPFPAGATFSYVDGSNEAVPGSALVNNIVMFNTKLNNLNNFMNDFRLSKKFQVIDFTLGFFKAYQNLSTSWLCNSYLQEVSDDNARLINVSDASGNPLSSNGLYSYGVPAWGGMHRNYDTQYSISAPYLNVSIEATEDLNIEAGVRYEYGDVSGSFSQSISTQYDMNSDGTISTLEQNVATVDVENPIMVDYNYSYWSYTGGVNYKFSNRQSIFARYSHGASAKADRILFQNLDYTDGDKLNARDFIDQVELGYKQRFNDGAVYATAFYANTTEEGGYEATSNSIIDNDYQSFGIELEGFYTYKNFDFRAALTYTKAEITSGDNKGNTPRRQPDFIYSFLPSYSFGNNKQYSVGLNFIGQTKAYSQDNNELVMPGFVMINGFVNVGITKGLFIKFSANNILDAIGITEAEEGSIIEGATNYVRARPLPGRSLSLSLSYSF